MVIARARRLDAIERCMCINDTILLCDVDYRIVDWSGVQIAAADANRATDDESTADVASSSAKAALPADPTGGAVSASGCLLRGAHPRILELRCLRHRILHRLHLHLIISSKHVSKM